MSDSKKTIKPNLPPLPDWLKQATAELDAEDEAFEKMPKKYTRATGMFQPSMDISPEPYEGKK